MPTSRSFICPACKEDRPFQDTPFDDPHGQFRRSFHPGSDEQYNKWLDFQATVHSITREQHSRRHTFLWACRHCLASGLAIKGDAKIQEYGMGGPIQAYVDLQENCDTCGKGFVYSAKEQQHWYETLRFHIDSYPKSCKPCRQSRRRTHDLQDRLGVLLAQQPRLNLQQLEEVASIYAELGRDDNAALFNRRASNQRRG